jgi:hypothetical protein
VDPQKQCPYQSHRQRPHEDIGRFGHKPRDTWARQEGASPRAFRRRGPVDTLILGIWLQICENQFCYSKPPVRRNLLWSQAKHTLTKELMREGLQTPTPRWPLPTVPAPTVSTRCSLAGRTEGHQPWGNYRVKVMPQAKALEQFGSGREVQPLSTELGTQPGSGG